MFKIITALFFMAFLLIPFADQRILATLPVYPLDIVFGAILIISLSVFWQKKEVLAKKNSVILIMLTFFFVSTFVSWGINNPTLTGLGQIKSWILLPALTLFLTAAVFATNKKRDHTLLMAWAGGILFLLAIMLPYVLSGIRTFDGRLQGPFTSPNFLAVYLFPSCVLGWYFFKQVRTSFEKSVIFCIVLFAVLTLFLTQSLGCILALVVSIFWFAFRCLHGKTLWRRGAIIGAAVVLFVIFTFIQNEKISSLFDERSSLTSRITIWQVAGKALQDNPVVGIGIGNFQSVYLSYQPIYPPYLEWAVPQPHNVWLAIWLQSGIMGIVVMLFFLYKITTTSRTSEKTNEARIVLESLCVGLLAYGLFDTPLFGNALAVIWWGVLAFLLFPVLEKEEKP